MSKQQLRLTTKKLHTTERNPVEICASLVPSSIEVLRAENQVENEVGKHHNRNGLDKELIQSLENAQTKYKNIQTSVESHIDTEPIPEAFQGGDIQKESTASENVPQVERQRQYKIFSKEDCISLLIVKERTLSKDFLELWKLKCKKTPTLVLHSQADFDKYCTDVIIAARKFIAENRKNGNSIHKSKTLLMLQREALQGIKQLFFDARIIDITRNVNEVMKLVDELGNQYLVLGKELSNLVEIWRKIDRPQRDMRRKFHSTIP